jgi:hypothetical protein
MPAGTRLSRPTLNVNYLGAAIMRQPQPYTGS